MAAKEPHASAKPSQAIPNPADVADLAKQQMDAMAGMQKEFMKTVEETNRQWAARVKTETELANEYVAKLSAARSLPETNAILQEWWTRRMALFAQDSQRFAADMEKFMTATMQMLPKQWSGGSS